MGKVGHSIDDCYTLKHRVMKLLYMKAFLFFKTTQPNVQKNPLPNHARGMNAIFWFDARTKKNLRIHVNDVL